jgi:SAM-dependent methyltransferase
MRWTRKAKIQKVCAVLPGGDLLYRQIQRRYGRLQPDPFKRLPQHAAMLRRLADLGFRAEGARCLEVGTGHLPIAPVAFHLLGAAEVVTVDLHRRLDTELTTAMIQRMVQARARIAELYAGLVDPALLDDRLDALEALPSGSPDDLRSLNVHYAAPGDAARMPDADDTFDLSFSMTVLEHVTPPAMAAILAETRRVLKPSGFAAHLIDPSDHFAHQDASITRINFLRFSEREWQRLGGNEFSYCNRLRAPDLERLFTDADFAIERCLRTVDERSVAAVKRGFPIHPDYRDYDPDDLCTTELELYARPRQHARRPG